MVQAARDRLWEETLTSETALSHLTQETREETTWAETSALIQVPASEMIIQTAVRVVPDRDQEVQAALADLQPSREAAARPAHRQVDREVLEDRDPEVRVRDRTPARALRGRATAAPEARDLASEETRRARREEVPVPVWVRAPQSQETTLYRVEASQAETRQGLPDPALEEVRRIRVREARSREETLRSSATPRSARWRTRE